MSQFKVGDRVVVVRYDGRDDHLYNGLLATVTEVGEDHRKWSVKAMSENSEEFEYEAEELELEAVYNSPLYQALL